MKSDNVKLKKNIILTYLITNFLILIQSISITITDN